MTPTATAIIIPHYNDVARLLRCLDALMPQVSLQIEVIVVDNASTDALDPVRSAYPNLRIVTEILKGAARARNRGVEETTAHRLFFLDCDCVPAPDWLATAFAVAERAEVVGGTVTVFDETPPPRTGAQAFETVFAFDNRGYIETKGFSVTANLLTTRDVFNAVGPFSAGLSEDLDWCRRATAKGFALVHEDSLRVAHPTRSDWPALERKWRRLTIEAWGLKGGGSAARLGWGLRALLMPLSAVAHMPRVVRAASLNGFAERGRAMGTLARLRMARCGWMLRQAAGGRI